MGLYTGHCRIVGRSLTWAPLERAWARFQALGQARRFASVKSRLGWAADLSTPFLHTTWKMNEHALKKQKEKKDAQDMGA